MVGLHSATFFEIPNPMPFRVYVIRLKTSVLKIKRFARENPDHIAYKPCVYVGSTALTPELRYDRHLNGKSGSKLVKMYHISLHKRLTARQPVFNTRVEAEAHEKVLAERLQRRGYAVWSR